MIFDSGCSDLNEKLESWLKWDQNSKTKSEIEDLAKSQKWDTLRARLLNRLQFGTAGLRGVMRAGFDSMNELVIVQTAQGLCDYIKSVFPPTDFERGVVFGFDGRYNSKRFAELSTTVFLNNKIKVYLYSKTVPTPFVPFAIMQKNCLAGVMVTASHNPKEDNGYKVFWSNGAQIIPPHDKAIQKSIEAHLTPLKESWDTSIIAKETGRFLLDPFDEMNHKYFTEYLKNVPQSFLENNSKSKLRFVYSAMHGVGYPAIEKVFKVSNLLPVLAVEEQRDPDPEFSTVKFPNPEEGKSSLELSIKKAEAENATIILANDPDADRLACAEKDLDTGSWKVFNGNELGALLGWWAVENYKELQGDKADLSNCYLLASTVSSKILKSIAKTEGLNFVETLTGFKWMGNRSEELIKSGKTVLFAFEEAIGFMFGVSVLDKDGVSAAGHLATMACHLKAKYQMTLTQKLKEIYDKFGLHCTNCSYLFCYEPPVIKTIFERIRNFDNGQKSTYPKSILSGKYAIKHVRDLTTGIDTSQDDKRALLPTSSSSQMITFSFENGLVVTLRTSGTEPKIKYYAEMCASTEDKDWDAIRIRLDEMVKAIVEEFLQPKINNLILKSD
ncbi:PGM2 family protein [Megaselia abdita]